MKITQLTTLKHKLQWLLLLAALLGVSQGMWAGGDTNGESLIVLSSENTTKRYTITSASWSVGCTSNLPTSGGNLSGQAFTVSSYDLVLKGAILGGWANGGNWMCGELQYKIYTGTEPGWSYYKVGNYDTGSGSADVMCTSGDNVYVGQKDGNVSLTEGKDPGSYTLKAQLYPRTRWDSGGSSYTYGVQGPVTATVNIDAYVYINSSWSKMTKSGSSYYYSVGSSGKTFRISNKQNYDTTFENNYSVGTSTGVTVTKSSNTYTATINSGYDASTLKIWIDPSTHKVYATADASCTAPTPTTTDAPTAIGTTTATLTGSYPTTSGYCAITEKGICYGTSADPTTEYEDETSGSGSISHSATGLSKGTTYYYRAYVKSEGTTLYGDNKSFKTKCTATKPTLSATPPNATNITCSSATLGGQVTNKGIKSSCSAQTLTYRGVKVYSNSACTDAYLVTTVNHEIPNSTAAYTVTVPSGTLSSGTTYYYKSYATNATGTSYSTNYKSFTTKATPSAVDISISSPASATTLYLGTGDYPSVTQTVTASCDKGDTYLWSATPTTYTSSSCWSSTATRVEFTSTSSKSTTATFYHEGVYTATFNAGCGNTSDASKDAQTITVKPGHIYFDGPFFSGSGYTLTKHHLEINTSTDQFVYEWTADENNTDAENDFIISVGSKCLDDASSAYTLGNYADLNLSGLTIPTKSTGGGDNCNHNFRADIGTITVGERLKLTVAYTGVNASGIPKYNVTLEKVCSNPTVQTVSGTATICDGSSTNVTVSSSQSNYTYKLYKGGSATATTKTGTGSALNFPVSDAGTYTVHAYYTSGSDTYCKADMTGSATVTVTPTASIGSVTLSSSSGCIGQGLSATANSVELGGGIGAWSSSNTSIATVSSTGTITPKAAGSANITYTITDGCGGTKSAQTSLTVNPNNSVAGVTISLDKNNVCAGVSVQASKSGTPVVSPGATAQWYSSTAKATIDPSTGAITTNSGGTSNISYRVTGGCGSTVETSAQTLTIKSIPTLTPASSSVENFTPVRIGANEDVTWSVAEQASDSYLFEQTARKTKFKGTVGAGANKTFTVNGTGANGCAGSATVTVTKDNESCN